MLSCRQHSSRDVQCVIVTICDSLRVASTPARRVLPLWSRTRKGNYNRQTLLSTPTGRAQSHSAQINNLIDCLKTPAMGQRCAWHVVERSWDRLLCARSPRQGQRVRAGIWSMQKQSGKPFFQWMCSWMTKACKTKEEHEVSKLLFVHFLDSDALLKKLGEQMVDSIKVVHKKAVYPHETNFVFHRR